MTIDWQKEAEVRKEDLLEDLKNLLRVNSERDDSKVTPNASFGPGLCDVLEHMLVYDERDGFKVKNADNYAGHIDLGEGDETLEIFGHMGVALVGDGWDTDPYELVIKDGKIFACGSGDDRGPGMVVCYAMKITKELDLKLSKKARSVVGSDEESGWDDMVYYFEHEEEPDFGFSSDVGFPTISDEKGNALSALRFRGDNVGDYVLKSFVSGLRENMVPRVATAVLQVSSADTAIAMEEALYQFIEASPVNGTIEADNMYVKIELAGKGVYGASPQSGTNAGSFLASFLDNYEFLGSTKQFIHVVAAYVHEDFYGEKLGVAYEDEKAGKLTMNAGLFAPEENGTKEANSINMNFRFPKGVTVDGLQSDIEWTVGQEGAIATRGARIMKLYYVLMDDPLMATLLQAYEDHIGEKGYEQIIGDRIYGRLLKHGVAYGAMLLGYTDTVHQANEFMSLDDLLRAAAIYVDAIYRLAK